MIDWLLTLQYYTRVLPVITTDVFPATPPLVKNRACKWFYTPNQRLVSIVGDRSRIIIDVVDTYRSDSLQLLVPVETISLMGWAEFPPNQVPRFADVVQRTNVKDNPVKEQHIGKSVLSTISRKAELISYLNKANTSTTLLMLISFYTNRFVVYVELMWDGIRLTARHYQIQGIHNTNFYALIRHGYIRVKHNSSRKSVEIDGFNLAEIDNIDVLHNVELAGSGIKLTYDRNRDTHFSVLYWDDDGGIGELDYDNTIHPTFDRHYFIYPTGGKIIAYDTLAEKPVQMWNEVVGEILGYDDYQKLLFVGLPTRKGTVVVAYRETKKWTLYPPKGKTIKARLVKSQWVSESRKLYLQFNTEEESTVEVKMALEN